MTIRVITPPAVYPVSIAEFLADRNMAQALSEDDTESADILRKIAAATQYVEDRMSGRALIQRTVALLLDAFPPCEIEVPIGPVLLVDSIEYVDDAGVTQTLDEDAYEVDVYSEPARIRPVFGTVWPALAVPKFNRVIVTMVVGYDDDGASPPDLAANVPDIIKQQIRLVAGHYYETREPIIPGTVIAKVPDELGVDAALFPYRWPGGY